MSEEDEDVLDQDENDQVEETTEETEVEASPVVEEKPQERPVFTMPVSKAQEEKRRAVEKAKEEARAESNAAMQRLREEYESKLRSSDPSNRSFEQELEAVATEVGLDVDASRKLFEVYRKGIAIPDMSRYDQLLQDQEIERHKLNVSREFEDSVVPLIKKDFPGVTDDHIRKIREEVSNLAFSEGYNAYKIMDIYKVNRDQFEFKNKMSAEPSGGHSGELVDFRRLDDADEIKLADTDPATYKRYLKWMEGQESRFND